MVRIAFRRAVVIAVVLGAGFLLGPVRNAAAQGSPRSEPTAAPSDDLHGPMRFELITQSASDECRGRCQKWITAVGMITDRTPADFEAFAKERDLSGAIIVLNSLGGVVPAGLALGRSVRKLGLSATVGRISKPSDGRFSLTLAGVCNSTCAFVILGGVRRYVPASAVIQVHQIWPAGSRDDATAASYSASTIVQIQRLLGQIARYVVDMGGDIELFELSTRSPPWENLRRLTRADMERLHLHNDDNLFPASNVNSTPLSALPPERNVNANGWLYAVRTGEPVLFRTHPLTIEGESVGRFELSFACADQADRYRVEYLETPESAALERREIDAVGVTFERKRTLLTADQSANAATSFRARALVASDFFDAKDQLSPIIVTTHTVSNKRSVIRIGRVGFAESFAKLAEACQTKSAPRANAR